MSAPPLRRLAALLALPLSVAGAQAPAGDFHQHLFSPAAAAMLSTPAATVPTLTAAEVVSLLDSAGIRRAMVLSVAYMYGSPARSVADEREKVRAENDWTAAQVSQYSERLAAACSVNPLKDYALDEIARCARHPVLRRALKLHFGNSDVRTDLPEHVERLKHAFRAANANGMAIVVHLHANITNARPYGAEQARTFIEHLLPEAPDVVVQVAHLAGAGGSDNPRADRALEALADAIARDDPRMRNVWFDVTAVVTARITEADARKVADQIRRIGPARVLYGTDASIGANARPRQGWAAFRTIPLTEAECGVIAANVPPYMR